MFGKSGAPLWRTEKRHEGELWRAMYALIINPISGNGRGKRELPRVEALLRRESVPYRTFVAESAAEARTYARQAVEENMTGVIAVGGDGTLFEVINGLAGSELTLLFACCGTGNDFIRDAAPAQGSRGGPAGAAARPAFAHRHRAHERQCIFSMSPARALMWMCCGRRRSLQADAQGSGRLSARRARRHPQLSPSRSARRL